MQFKSTMLFNDENRKPTTEDLMRLFHEPGFQSTSDSFIDHELVDPMGRIIALT